jgi:hypothetical protein
MSTATIHQPFIPISGECARASAGMMVYPNIIFAG